MPDVAASLGTTAGALSIASQVSFLLFGILVLQCYRYFTKTSRKDPWMYRLIVVTIMILELAHAICVSVYTYQLTVVDFGNKEAILIGPITMSLDLWIFFSGSVGPIVQAFFTYRIKIVSRSHYIPILCWGLLLLRFVFNMMLFTSMLPLENLHQMNRYSRVLFCSCVIMQGITDFFITYCLCRIFNTYTGQSLPGTIHLLEKLRIWTIETTILPTSASLLCLILYWIMPNTLVWAGIYACVPRMSSNNLLATLNARTHFSKIAFAPEHTVNLTRHLHDAGATGTNIQFATCPEQTTDHIDTIRSSSGLITTSLECDISTLDPEIALPHAIDIALAPS